MSLEELIKTRRSIRKFSEQKIDQAVLEKIIEAGNYAPSHCNTQGWKFIFVDNQNIKNEITKSGGSHVVKSAPYGILITYNLALSDNLEYKDWIQSSSGAIQNMLLTIHDLGLGGCWICHLPRKKTLAKIFNIPKPYTPVAYIAFGYSQQESAAIPRQHEVSDILAINEFNWPSEKTSTKIRFKRITRRLYFILPTPLKKLINPLVDKFVKKFHN